MKGNFASLRDTLARVGYLPELLEDGHANEAGTRVPWCAGYVRLPRTARNACVVAVHTGAAQIVEEVLSGTGAPIALALSGHNVVVWQRETKGARKREVLPLQAFIDLEDRARELLDPRSIHRAKTLGRFDGTYQLDFVDVGLLPRIEKAQGKDLQRLLERIVAALRRPTDTLTTEQRHQVLTIAFWILAARMLRDHQVPGFVNLKAESRAVLSAVARHYGGAVPVLAANAEWGQRVNEAIAIAWKVNMDLAKVGPEAIAEVHESSLIARQTRKDLGTHSTPPFLVEYVLGRLRKEILKIPPERRLVVEPASGHGAFLVAALGVLAEDLPANAARHDYLRARLRGLEIDHAAKELARLSLTLADVPNPDGWDLREGDMFEGNALAELARGATVLLANPPFEDFDAAERERLVSARGDEVLSNKAAEMLRRVLPALESDAVIGVVVPRPFLHAQALRQLRRALVEAFQLIEICVFPDRIFQFSDSECAVILARAEPGGTKRNAPVVFRRVREAGMAAFRECAKVSTEEVVAGAIFLDSPDTDFTLPDLRRLWISRSWSTLSNLATVQQGLAYHGWVRESGYETVRAEKFEGSALGVAGAKESSNTLITDDPPYSYMDITREHVRRFMGGLPTGKPQVVLNAHPHGRGPWRLLAFIDPKGAAVPTSRFVVRPTDPSLTVEVLWALCNSMMANAFVYAHFDKRNITAGGLGNFPIPAFSKESCHELTQMVRELFVKSKQKNQSAKALLEIMRQIDAAVLGAYGLFASAEHMLLALFEGHPRPGLPFDVDSFENNNRIPQYLNLPDVNPALPPVSAIGRFSFLADLDSEIEDGRRELAALRRMAPSGDARVQARIAFVRAMTRGLESHAADVWIPDLRST